MQIIYHSTISQDGVTPLHEAASSGLAGMAQQLIEADAVFDARAHVSPTTINVTIRGIPKEVIPFSDNRLAQEIA